MRRSVSVLLAVFVMLPALVACGRTYVVRSLEETCDPHGKYAGGVQRIEVSGGRPYLLSVPASYRPDVRTPVLVLFHGWGSNPRTAIHATGMYEKAAETGHLLVAPQGRPFSTPGSPRAGWGLGGAGYEQDLRYVREVLDDVSSRACAAEDRITFVGFSNGSAFSLKIACRGDIVLAAHAGVGAPYWGEDCSGAEPLPLMYIHGTEDPVVKFAGGSSPIGPTVAVQDMLVQRARVNECHSAPVASPVGEEVRRDLWLGCTGNNDVEAYVIDGGGHRWPGAISRSTGLVRGDVNREIDATDLIVRFFAATWARSGGEGHSGEHG